MIDEKKIKDHHKRGFKALFSIFTDDKKLLKSFQFWIAIAISVSSISFISILDVNTFKVLIQLTNTIIGVVPNILGFNLGAYVIITSLSSDKIINELSENTDSDYTTFQQLSSVFAWSILIQSITLIVAFLFSFVISFELDFRYSNSINLVALSVLLPFSIYSILLIYRVVMNVFAISQVIHFFTIIFKLENKKDDNDYQG